MMAATVTGPPADAGAEGDVPVKRRDFLYIATGTIAAAGAAITTWPIIDSLNPSADILSSSSTLVDLEPIAIGQRVTVVWRGRPVFISRRTKREIALAEQDDHADLRDPATDSERVQRKEWLIVIGICTHLGCVPTGQSPGSKRGDWEGWFCACHGSVYDTSGRIRKGPAPRNLDLPPYKFLSDTRIWIGDV